jgi:hypothetical protein
MFHVISLSAFLGARSIRLFPPMHIPLAYDLTFPLWPRRSFGVPQKQDEDKRRRL